MFGISPLGWVHTLGSLPALPIALLMLFRYGRIVPRSGLGKAYGAFMLLGVVTVYPLAHSSTSVGLATLTLVLLIVGFTVGRLGALGRACVYIETISLTLTVFLLLVPTVTEIFRRVPEGHPIAADLGAPILKAAHLTLLVGLVVVLVAQIRAMRHRPAAISPAGARGLSRPE
jgi:hypothetical protein